ncbi:MAG TPA: hypothetical protein VK926_04425 [Gaiellaceae bacterium]|nr:hypothetical protein [Gaiellaceae bacterium]
MGKQFALFAAASAIAIALVGTALASHSWGNYHWARSANPLTLDVGDNVDSRWDAYLDEAISDWNTSSVLALSKVGGGTNPTNCRPTSGRIEACNASYGNTGWLGLAQIWVSGSHIAQAVTKVNDTYFDTTTYNRPEWRRLVMCQEIAHDFGLAHQDENFSNPNLGSCMDYTSNPLGPPSNEHPNKHDYDQLATIYGHLDGSSGGGGGSSGCPGKSKKCRNGLDKAPPFSQASRANGDVYVDDVGNGVRRITHVFWTPFGEQ